jgi:hypothetical protein
MIDLDAIEARAKAADLNGTPLYVAVQSSGLFSGLFAVGIEEDQGELHPTIADNIPEQAWAMFFAAAPTDIATLIARVRELETALTFYSNPLDYEEYRPPNYSRRSAMEGDLGYTARKALGALNEGDIEYEAQWGGDK